MPHEIVRKRVRFSLQTDVRLIPSLREDDKSRNTTPKKSKGNKSDAKYDVELQLAIQLSLGTSSLENTVQGAYGYPGTSGTFSSWYPEASGPALYPGEGQVGAFGIEEYPGAVETGIADPYPGDSWRHTLKALREDEKREERRGHVLVECPVCSIKKKSKRINQHLEDYHGFK